MGLVLWHPLGVDDASNHLEGSGRHAFNRGGPGGGDGQPTGPRGCLFGWWTPAHDDAVRARPPVQGVAALGLVIVMVCVLLYWFVAR